MARRELIADASGRRFRSTQRLGYMDGWREDGFGQRTDDGGGCATMANDRKDWRALMHMLA